METKVLVQEAAFDTGKETDALASASTQTGGVVTFTGVVRDINEGDAVRGLHLEHYPGMTEKQITEIIDQAAGRWTLMAATVIHRVGDLKPSDQIVFVGVAAAHRGEAFDACEFIIDFLKTRATFWKKEQTSDGGRWLTTRQSDIDTVKDWTR